MQCSAPRIASRAHLCSYTHAIRTSCTASCTAFIACCTISASHKDKGGPSSSSSSLSSLCCVFSPITSSSSSSCSSSSSPRCVFLRRCLRCCLCCGCCGCFLECGLRRGVCECDCRRRLCVFTAASCCLDGIEKRCETRSRKVVGNRGTTAVSMINERVNSCTATSTGHGHGGTKPCVFAMHVAGRQNGDEHNADGTHERRVHHGSREVREMVTGNQTSIPEVVVIQRSSKMAPWLVTRDASRGETASELGGDVRGAGHMVQNTQCRTALCCSALKQVERTKEPLQASNGATRNPTCTQTNPQKISLLLLIR